MCKMQLHTHLHTHTHHTPATPDYREQRGYLINVSRTTSYLCKKKLYGVFMV